MNLKKINEILDNAIGDLADGIEETIQVGQDFEYGNIRVHRYAASLYVTNTDNAGKRGKTVDMFIVSGIDLVQKEDETLNLVNSYLDALSDKKFRDYASALDAAKKMVAECARIRGSKSFYVLRVIEEKVKSINVRPAAFSVIKIEGKHVSLTAGYKNFHVLNKDDRANEPTLIPPAKGGSTATKKFYDWVSRNVGRIEAMTFQMIYDEMHKQGIGAHYYCAVD